MQPQEIFESLDAQNDPICFVQVGNMKKETSAVWYKDGTEIKADEHLGFTEGVLKLEIAQVRKKMF